MNKILFSGILLFSLSCLHAQDYFMTSPVGFGAATTGGGSATPVVVSTYQDLKNAILASPPAVILVSGTITIPDGGAISAIVTDKTILGLPGARLVNNTATQNGSGIFYLKNGSSNVIIRNLIFEGPGAYDVDGQDNLTADGCINLWVDHCEFQDGLDGNYDNKGNTDNVSISWCKFTYLKPAIPGGSGGANDHRFSNLVGSSSTNAPADGHYSITFQNCYWADGCRERMPRARNGELHILNCYYNTSVSGSRAIGLGGGINNLTCYVENTDFANIGTAFKDYTSTDGGTVAINFSGCLNGSSNVGSVPMPTYSYSAFPAENVATYVSDPTCGAGATLQVTTEGVISTSCNSSGINDVKPPMEVKFYPAIINGTLNIEFPGDGFGHTNINIYSASGKLVYSVFKNINSIAPIELNLNALAKGVYFCRIQNNKMAITRKLMKA